ncbi:MAG: 5' nucleotidase, NT5C type [Dethiobacteraceae bacterium]|jgi:hypothetical protein
MRIGIDICNTIADIITPLAGCLLKRGESDGLNEMLRHYHSPAVTPDIFKENPDIFSRARPLKGAAECLHMLAKEHELFYVTARPEWARQITEQWLRRNGFPKAPLIMSCNKPKVIAELGIDLMLEDAPHEIRGLRKICRVIVRKAPYNTEFPERFSWKQGVAV